MSLIAEIGAELRKMFMGDLRLFVGTLALVGLAAALIETGALAPRILFDGRRAVGIAYEQRGRVREARAGGEVILALGAINSPQLLQLSGVGPASLLASHGIEVRLDSPAVGDHLQDHVCYDHVYRMTTPSLNDVFRPWSGKLAAGLRYLLARRGPLALSLNQGGGFFRSRPGLEHPNMQLYFSPLSYEQGTPGVRRLMSPDPFSGVNASVSPCRPSSRGRVEIRSADPKAPPAIDLNLLGAEDDRREMLEGARFLRRLAATPAFSSVLDAEVRPGVDCADDEQLAADISERSYSVFHASGSCRMGPEPRTAVVDHRLRVHGLSGLRVIDASVFPLVTSGNTNAPAMMVGEKGAALILEDLG